MAINPRFFLLSVALSNLCTSLRVGTGLDPRRPPAGTSRPQAARAPARGRTLRAARPLRSTIPADIPLPSLGLGWLERHPMHKFFWGDWS